MAPSWTTFDFPPLPSTRPVTQSTRPVTQSTRPPSSSILGHPPTGPPWVNNPRLAGGSHSPSRPNNGRGRSSGFERGGGSHSPSPSPNRVGSNSFGFGRSGVPLSNVVGVGGGPHKGRVFIDDGPVDQGSRSRPHIPRNFSVNVGGSSSGRNVGSGPHSSKSLGNSVVGGSQDEYEYEEEEMCEKFDELEVIEESCKLAKQKGISMIKKSENGSGNGGMKVIYEGNEEIPVEASGEEVPNPVSRFDEIELGEGLSENIRRCKYEKPTPIQCHAIPILMAGRDLMACAQTGSGKTAAFCFPIIAGILKNGPPFRPVVVNGGRRRVACPLALIMAPTRELSSQIHDEAKKFAHQTGVKVVVAYGGTPMFEQVLNLEKGVDILVATPGRLVDLIERGRVSLRMVKYFTLDEADRMLDMGFEPQIRKIAELMDMPPAGARQTMLFSATFPTEIQRLASDFLYNYIFLTVGKVGSSNDMIEQNVEFVTDHDKKERLKELLVSQKMNGINGEYPLTIVFVETKRAADDLAYWLSGSGFPATAIHGDKAQVERERALRSFKFRKTPIIVATDVAARGLDIPCVAHVINFDLPKDIEYYVHRIGRTGRAGNSGVATAFFCDKDIPISKALVELMEDSNQAVPSWLTEYAHASPFVYGGGGGNRRNRGSRFGGRDYRTSDPASSAYSGYSDNSNYYSEDYSSSRPEDYSFGAIPFATPANTSTPGHDSIVPSGWD